MADEKTPAQEALQGLRDAVAKVGRGEIGPPSHMHQEGPRAYSCRGGDDCPDRRPRTEAIREQLSEILFGDQSHSIAQCLSELRRRKLTECRLAAWFVESDDALRSRTQSVCGEKLVDYRRGIEAFAGAGRDGLPEDADTWTELDAALDGIGFPRGELAP